MIEKWMHVQKITVQSIFFDILDESIFLSKIGPKVGSKFSKASIWSQYHWSGIFLQGGAIQENVFKGVSFNNNNTLDRFVIVKDRCLKIIIIKKCDLTNHFEYHLFYVLFYDKENTPKIWIWFNQWIMNLDGHLHLWFFRNIYEVDFRWKL